MAKKVKKEAGVMEQLAAYSPPWNDPDEEDKKGPTADDQVKSLTEQLAKMQAKIDGFERKDAFRSFQAGPAPTTTNQEPVKAVKKGLDFNGLPDPVSDTEKWQGELQRRVADYVEYRTTEVQQQAAAMNEQVALANNLWGGFQKAHPEWAEQEMLVEAAAGRVTQSLAGRGVNVAQLVKQQPEIFYSEVAGMLEKQFPQLKGKAGEETDGGDEEEETGAVVFGGQAGGKAGSLAGELSSAASNDEANRAWVREIGEARLKAGLR